MKTNVTISKGGGIAIAQSVIALAVFVLLASLTTRADVDTKPLDDCCPGTEQCEWASQCFDEGFVYDGWRCRVELGICDWVPVN